ncbi:MAG: NfeD family protein [Paeniclostridium sordellii]|uniref:NfeD family protein n=1 Tax=Paeniclostridium hominis TaxID=2764329 RepID=A0ABR7JZX1_9FIRM|nr:MULTISPECIES: NfeD family protein [Paeniclostridium]MBC6002358.1 NfeD family protein [Paeniclostridium hominis]MDU2591773.1 NfeD family protein [Paeniclostridium sordellii]
MFLTWIIIGIILLIIESSTISFVSLFFAIGCFVAGLSSLIVSSIGTQIIIMCIVSIIGVIFGRKILQKYFDVNKEVKPSTINALIGKIGVVTKEINQDGIGLVKIEGEVWSATSVDSKYIPKDVNVLIKYIDGVKLVVEKI